MPIKNNNKSYILNYDPENYLKMTEEVKRIVKENNFCIVKNFNDAHTQKKIYKFIQKKFDEASDIRVSGGFIYKMKDYCRLDVGDSYKNSRFSRNMVFCEWNKKNKDLFELIKPLLSFRNAFSGISQFDYQYDLEDKIFSTDIHEDRSSDITTESCFCDVIRSIQYPIGGGFLATHNDLDEKFYHSQIFNVLLPVTSRVKKHGNDDLETYDKGGLYYIHNGEKIDVENLLDSGDLIIHNQYIDHGVNSIDPDKELDINSFCGRITLNISIGRFIKNV